jgi:hypothetical protein
VGKLHNPVVDICNMHQLSQLFQKVQKEAQPQKTLLRLIIDNNTRWLSQLYTIRRSLLLKTSLKLLLLRAREEWDQENMSRRTGRVPPGRLAKFLRCLHDTNQLLDKDWEVLQHLELILTTFETVVKTLEGDGQIRTRQSGLQGPLCS